MYVCNFSSFQQQDNMCANGSSGPEARGAQLCLICPVNEKSQCVQSQQTSKPQSELRSDLSGSPPKTADHQKITVKDSSSLNTKKNSGEKKNQLSVSKEKQITMPSLMLPKQEDTKLHLIPVMLYMRGSSRDDSFMRNRLTYNRAKCCEKTQEESTFHFYLSRDMSLCVSVWILSRQQ